MWIALYFNKLRKCRKQGIGKEANMRAHEKGEELGVCDREQ